MLRRWFAKSKVENEAIAHPETGNGALMIDLRQVVKTYQSAAGEFTALRGIDLGIGRGEFVAIIGKSGSGKSTMINMVTGIDRPSSGEVFVGGTPVHTLNESQMAVWRRGNLGIVFQFFQLLPALSLVENVMLPMDFRRSLTPRERHSRAMHLLDQVGMAQHATKMPSAVSGGQQQRVAIARALANNPPLLIADEPTGNLDSKTAESVFQLFAELVKGGTTVVMVTHDNDLASRVHRAVIVVDGRIVNQYVAEALAPLNVDQLTWATSKLQHRTYSPGSLIVRQGDPADMFFIITKGRCDIVVQHPGGQEIPVNHLDEGQYFGEIGLLQGGKRIASVRAAIDGEVEVMVLDRESFDNLVAEAPEIKDEFTRMVQQRVAQLHTTRKLE